MWHDHAFSHKETGQQKEQWEWGLEVTQKWGNWTKFEKRRGGTIKGVFIKQGGQHLCANYVKRLKKKSHPPPPPPPPPPPHSHHHHYWLPPTRGGGLGYEGIGKNLKQNIHSFTFETSTIKVKCKTNYKSYFSTRAGKIHLCSYNIQN